MSSGFSFGIKNAANRLARLGLPIHATRPVTDDPAGDRAPADSMTDQEFDMLHALLVAQSHRLRPIALELLFE